MVAGETLKFRSIEPEQHFTEPPPRFTEATLVKELEADGVGRPSTYASILSTIQEREYVRKEGGKFFPTELGMVVTDLLLESFNDLFDVTYTARMEAELDEIEEGKIDWRMAMSEFYERFQKDLEHAARAHDRHQADGGAHRLDLRQVRQADGDQMGQARPLHRLHRLSRLHQYARAAGRYADIGRRLRAGRSRVLRKLRPSHGAEEGPLRAVSGVLRLSGLQDHQAAGRGAEAAGRSAGRKMPAMRQQHGRKYGRYGEFVACSNYPTCKHVKQKTIGVKCPNCSEGEVVERRSKRGKTFYGCNRYPDCDFVAWGKPLPEKCPECGGGYLIEKFLKSGPVAQCPNDECKFKKPLEVPGRNGARGCRGGESLMAEAVAANPPKPDYGQDAPVVVKRMFTRGAWAIGVAILMYVVNHGQYPDVSVTHSDSAGDYRGDFLGAGRVHDLVEPCGQARTTRPAARFAGAEGRRKSAGCRLRTRPDADRRGQAAEIRQSDGHRYLEPAGSFRQFGRRDAKQNAKIEGVSDRVRIENGDARKLVYPDSQL